MTLPSQYYTFSTHINRPRHTDRADIVIGLHHKMNTNCSLTLPRLHGQSSIRHPQAAASGTVHNRARATAYVDQSKFPCETPAWRQTSVQLVHTHLIAAKHPPALRENDTGASTLPPSSEIEFQRHLPADHITYGSRRHPPASICNQAYEPGSNKRRVTAQDIPLTAGISGAWEGATDETRRPDFGPCRLHDAGAPRSCA